MEAGTLHWLLAWLLVWTVPAVIVNVGLARRRRRPVWGWGVAAIPLGWVSSLVLQRLGPPGATPLRREAAGHGTSAVAEAAAAGLPEGAAEPAALAWVTVGHWSGSGSRRTDFFIASRCWRVRWKTTGSEAILGGMLQARLYREDRMPVVDSFLANTTQPGQGSADLDAGPGRFSMLINSVGFDWEISVDELR